MTNIEQSITVSVPQNSLCDSVMDFDARPQWEPRIKEAKILDGGPLKEVSRIRLVVDQGRFAATVVEIRPPERLSLLVKGPGFRVNHIYQISLIDDQAEVMVSGEHRGLIGGLVVPFVRGSVTRDLVDELGAIKRVAEAGPAG